MEQQSIKNILILTSSARKGGNTDLLCDEFIKGARQNGHGIEKVYVATMNIKGCIGCRMCQSNGGTCVQKDDMTFIYEKIKQADVIVFSSPVYFYSFNSQLKAVMDRSFAIEHIIKDKKAYLISSGAAPELKYMSLITEHFQKYLSCFNNITCDGIVIGCGNTEKRDVIGNPAMKEAYEMGLSIK